MKTKHILCSPFLFIIIITQLHGEGAPPQKTSSWTIGKPIVTYWAGPTLDDRVAKQMAEGGFNLVWSYEKQLDIAHRHGLRVMIRNSLLSPGSLDDPSQRRKLNAFIDRVKKHPALYAYYIIDEPGAAQFPALGRLLAYLKQRDPAHLAYINLFPTYANNKQLGTTGDTITAYSKHLEQYMNIVKPKLISYDHYQFKLKGDGNQYFLNLNMIRKQALKNRVPFLNIVQACTWAPKAMRIPNPNELRYLVYTTVAYGAQGISYYVYAHVNHHGSIVSLDGTPGPLYYALKSYNPEFTAIAKELQPLHSLAVYHTAMKEPGCISLPADIAFQLDNSKFLSRPRGFLLGLFGSKKKSTHVVIVNLDYKTSAKTRLIGPAELEVFNPEKRQWIPAVKNYIDLTLLPGGGKLLRVRAKM